MDTHGDHLGLLQTNEGQFGCRETLIIRYKYSAAIVRNYALTRLTMYIKTIQRMLEVPTASIFQDKGTSSSLWDNSVEHKRRAKLIVN